MGTKKCQGLNQAAAIISPEDGRQTQDKSKTRQSTSKSSSKTSDRWRCWPTILRSGAVNPGFTSKRRGLLAEAIIAARPQMTTHFLLTASSKDQAVGTIVLVTPKVLPQVPPVVGGWQLGSLCQSAITPVSPFSGPRQVNGDPKPKGGATCPRCLVRPRASIQHTRTSRWWAPSRQKLSQLQSRRQVLHKFPTSPLSSSHQKHKRHKHRGAKRDSQVKTQARRPPTSPRSRKVKRRVPADTAGQRQRHSNAEKRPAPTPRPAGIAPLRPTRPHWM